MDAHSSFDAATTTVAAVLVTVAGSKNLKNHVIKII